MQIAAAFCEYYDAKQIDAKHEKEQIFTTMIHVGDCADVLPKLGISPNLILTSPPYDNLRNYGGHVFDFERVADALVAVMPKGGVLVWIVADATVEGSETGTNFRQALGFVERGLRLHDTMIWHKNNPGSWNPNRYQQDWEYMFVFSKDTPGVANMIKDRSTLTAGRVWRSRVSKGRMDTNGGKRTFRNKLHSVADKALRSGVWYIPVVPMIENRNGQTYKHPATFPYALAADHIRTWTNPGDLVLDPMAGSGTVLRAAKDLGRRYCGIEIHAPYVDIIHKRMAQEVLSM